MGGIVCIMGVIAYLINGFNVGEEVNDIKNSVKRNNLTTIPDIIKFTIDEYNGIKIYRNSINNCVSFQKYGEFNTYKEAYNSFYNDNGEVYDNLYLECLSVINKQYKVNLQDTDWNTLLCVNDEQELPFVLEKQNVVVVNNMDIENNVYIRAIIDSCLIYQSVSRITDFVKKLVLANELTKFQQFQIAYYSQELIKVKNPDMFLTNRNEIEVYKKIYSEWELGSQIDNAIEMLNQSISNYSFLWEYRNSSIQKFSNLLLTLFTIIVGYPALKNVFEEFLPNGLIYLKCIYIILIMIFIFRMIWLQIDNIREIIDFRKRRK